MTCHRIFDLWLVKLRPFKRVAHQISRLIMLVSVDSRQHTTGYFVLLLDGNDCTSTQIFIHNSYFGMNVM